MYITIIEGTRLLNKFDWIKLNEWTTFEAGIEQIKLILSLITEGLLDLKSTLLNTLVNALQTMRWEKLCQKIVLLNKLLNS
jgi:hypothetical protein